MQFGTARPWSPTPPSNTLDTGGGMLNSVVVPKSDPTNYTYFANGANNGTNGAQYCFYVTGQCTIAKFDPLRGQDFFTLDTRLTKNFKFGEHRELSLIAQAFNLTNRANYGNNYITDINSSGFGKPQGFINPTATNIPRSLTGEFGVTFRF